MLSTTKYYRPTIPTHNLVELVAATQVGACILAQCNEHRICEGCCCGADSPEGELAFEEWKKELLNRAAGVLA